MLRTTLAAAALAAMTFIGSDASAAQYGNGGASASAPKAKSSQAGPAVPEVLRKIAQCESGGDPTAVSRSGQYRGKYQFSRPTWRAYGGVGDPAAAPEAEQDRIAIKLYKAEGTKPWPNCA